MAPGRPGCQLCGAQGEAQSTDQMPVHESPDVDHMGPPHSSQRAPLSPSAIPKSHSVGKEVGFSSPIGNESLLQDLGVSQKCNCPDRKTAAPG